MTINQVIQRLRRQLPDADDTTILDYINEVHDDLLSLVPLNRTEEDISLVANQTEYTLNPSTVRVWEAEYLRSATDRRPLKGEDITRLALAQPTWRNMPAGVPRRFFIDRDEDEQIVGILPKPNVTTSGGYPIVKLHVTRTETLTRTSNVPVGISGDVYVFGAMARFFTDPNLAEYWNTRYMRQKESDVKKFKFMNVMAPPATAPGWLPRSGRV